jgi:hypothetical protein
MDFFLPIAVLLYCLAFTAKLIEAYRGEIKRSARRDHMMDISIKNDEKLS